MAFVAAVGVTIDVYRAFAVAPEAERLFQEGRQLLLEEKYAEACVRLGESYAVEASSGTLINLALCNERLGKVATAWRQYRETIQLAQTQGRPERAAAAAEKAAEVERRVPRVTLTAGAHVQGLRVSLDGGTLR